MSNKIQLKENNIELQKFIDIFDSMPDRRLEEERTIDAATETIEVLPTSEDVTMSKVTVNPTVNQAKTVNASSIAQTVTPDSGKLLNSVRVNGMFAGEFNDITINSSGLVSSGIKSNGYFSSSSNKTLQLSTQAGSTITPGAANKLAIASGKYATGAITVKGDSNLISRNIKEGVTLFGVEGTAHEGVSPINSILEDYKATTTDIDTNTFVKYVEGLYDKATIMDTKNTTSRYNYEYVNDVFTRSMRATKLDEDRILLTYSGDTNLYLYGTVCTINDDGTISLGTETLISNVANTGIHDAVKIDTNKVFIVLAYSMYSYLNGVVCSISNSTISVGTNTRIDTNDNQAVLETIVRCYDTNKVAIIYQNVKNMEELYCYTCSVSGTSITKGTKLLLNIDALSYFATFVSTNKLVLTISIRAENRMVGVVLTMSGLTPTIWEPTDILYRSWSTSCLPLLINDNKIIYIFNSFGQDQFSYAVIYQIEGTKVTLLYDPIKLINKHAVYSDCVIDENNILVTSKTNGALDICQININEDELRCGSIITLVQNPGVSLRGYNVPIFFMKSGKYVYTAYVDNFTSESEPKIYGMTFVPEKGDGTIDIAIPGDEIFGLTKTKCTNTTAGQVFVVN